MRSCGIARRGERDPVLRVAGRRRWRPAAPAVASRGIARQRCPQVAPGRGARRRRRTRRRLPARPSSSAHCTTTSPGSKRPRPRTTRSEDRSRSLAVGGSRYHADRSTAGCWVPLRQLPITGVRAGSRLNGSRARDPLTPAAAVVPPSVPASLALTVAGLGVGEVADVPGFSITGSAETSVGMPLGPNPSAVTAPSASPTGDADGSQQPGVGVLFDHHVVGQPARLAGERLEVRAADCSTPGTGRSSPSVSDSTSNNDQHPRGNRQRASG